jgi:hypothetical protein
MGLVWSLFCAFWTDFANKLNQLVYDKPLIGTLLDYQSSVDHDLIKVEDLGMGTTAIATQKHLGYLCRV